MKPRIGQIIIDKIVDLKEKGHSIPEMHIILGLPKSTIFRYSKDVQILPRFQQRWLDRRNASKIMSERSWVIARRHANEFRQSINNQSLGLIAAALYWAEGSKKDFSITNSDPDLVNVFVSAMRFVFGVKDNDFKISLRLYEDIGVEQAIGFWSKVLKIDLKERVSINVLKGKKIGKLKYGMCRVRVKKAGLLLKTIFAINKLVIESISL